MVVNGLKNNQKSKTLDIATGSGLRSGLERKFGGTEPYKAASSYHYKRYLAEQGVSVRDVVRALGYDQLGSVKVRELLENDGTKPLFNSIVEDGLRMGWQKESNWERLVADTVDSDQLSQQWYYLDHDEDWYELREVGQGAPIPTGTIKLGDNSIKMHKRGRGLEWTDEAKRANIDMVALWLRQLGRQLGRQYENVAVTRFLNGYFPDGSDAAPTLGINTANDLRLGDLFYGQKYMEQNLGFTPDLAIMNLDTAYKVTNLREEGGSGSFIYSEEMKNGNFADVVNSAPFISNQVPDDRIVLVDTSFGLVRYSGKPFTVESERSAKTQVEGSYGSEISEFVPFEPNARLILTLDTAR